MATEEFNPELAGGDHDEVPNETQKTVNEDEHVDDAAINISADCRAGTEDEDDESDMPALIESHPDTPTSLDGAVVTNGDKTETDAEVTRDETLEWMDVIGNEQLRKKIQKEGQGAATRPKRGELVTVRSKGSLEDGSEVDCHKEISFILGEGDVVSAWDMCLSLMDLGEISIIKTSPRFAYGEIGRAPDVPPNAHITYELELLNVQAAPDPEDMAVDELCAMGNKKRERGNELYSRKDYPGAINSYTIALKLLEKAKVSNDDGTKQTVMDLKVKCYNNLAAAQLKIDAYQQALKSCVSALDIEPENVKALFRKGKVLACQGDYEQAVKTMKDALAKQPSNKVIHQELSRLTSQESKERQSERQLYQRMVGDMASVTKVTPKKTINKWLFAAVSIGVVILAVIAALSTQRFEPVS